MKSRGLRNIALSLPEIKYKHNIIAKVKNLYKSQFYAILEITITRDGISIPCSIIQTGASQIAPGRIEPGVTGVRSLGSDGVGRLTSHRVVKCIQSGVLC